MAQIEAVEKPVKAFNFHNAICNNKRTKVNAFVSQKGFDPNGKSNDGSYFYSIVESLLDNDGFEDEKYVAFRVKLIVRLKEMGGIVQEDAIDSLRSFLQWAKDEYKGGHITPWQYERALDAFNEVYPVLIDEEDDDKYDFF